MISKEPNCLNKSVSSRPIGRQVAHSSKMILSIHFTKLLKRDNIDIIFMDDMDDNCLVLNII